LTEAQDLMAMACDANPQADERDEGDQMQCWLPLIIPNRFIPAALS